MEKLSGRGQYIYHGGRVNRYKNIICPKKNYNVKKDMAGKYKWTKFEGKTYDFERYYFMPQLLTRMIPTTELRRIYWNISEGKVIWVEA